MILIAINYLLSLKITHHVSVTKLRVAEAIKHRSGQLPVDSLNPAAGRGHLFPVWRLEPNQASTKKSEVWHNDLQEKKVEKRLHPIWIVCLQIVYSL